MISDFPIVAWSEPAATKLATLGVLLLYSAAGAAVEG
jgi:hypothetical protein